MGVGNGLKLLDFFAQMRAFWNSGDIVLRIASLFVSVSKHRKSSLTASNIITGLTWENINCYNFTRVFRVYKILIWKGLCFKLVHGVFLKHASSFFPVDKSALLLNIYYRRVFHISFISSDFSDTVLDIDISCGIYIFTITVTALIYSQRSS